MKKTFFILAVLTPLLSLAQTGPGGIGDISGTSSMELWLDSEDVNADGTNPSIGAAVTTWYDKSGNSVDVTQNISNVATYTANGVRFNNIGYLNGSDATFPTGNSARTVFICASSPNTANDDVLFFYGTASNNRSYGILKLANEGVRNYFFGNDLDDAGGWLPVNQMKIVNARYQNPSQQVYVDGTLSSSKSTGAVNTTLGTQGLQIGGWNSFNLFSNATIAEIIFFSKAVNTAEKAILENYLSEKYGVTLSSTDYYSGHTGAYTNGVMGIGTSDGTAGNSHSVSNDSKGLEIQTANGSFNAANEYVFTGYASATNTPTTADLGSLPDVQFRWERVWYLDKTGNVDVKLSFDVSTTGASGSPSAADYVLLYSPTNAFAFQDWTTTKSITASAVGTVISFTVTNTDLVNGYYTIATKNEATSPLPIELLSFDARPLTDQVVVNWKTAMEVNNDFFTVERSADGVHWETITTVRGAGNSTSPLTYSVADDDPLTGISYYRLTQTDYDGTTSTFKMVAVQIDPKKTGIRIYPNPAVNEFVVEGQDVKSNDITIFSSLWGEVALLPSQEQSNKVTYDVSALPNGIYYLKVTTDGKAQTQRLVVHKAGDD